MCGIFGALALDGDLDAGRFGLPDDTGVLRHRGPDDHGHYLDRSIFLGHRRLSIIDLSTGRQPIFNEDGSQCIVFNGEVFNFNDIRHQLEAKGHVFRTQSDTETIVHAYEEWGESCVDHFRGMFVFAIWDARRRVLFIARDRLGIKPLFYCRVGDTLLFASEMKAILRYPQVPRDMDCDALACYLKVAYIPSPLTIFRSIRKLPAGHTLTASSGRITIHKYWDVQFAPNRTRSEASFADEVLAELQDSVRLRLISDVPLGAFLSGGLDSAAIVALMSRLGANPVRTFTIGFGGDVGGYLDERGYAREVAERFGTEHQEHEVTPDFHGLVQEIVRAFDEPFADPSTIPTHYVSMITRRAVTVALSGLGGDEMFGGYERYLGYKLSTTYDRIPRVIRERLIRPIVEALPERTDGHYTVNHMKRFVRAASQDGGSRYLGMISMGTEGRRQSLLANPADLAGSFDACDQIFLDHFNGSNADSPLDRVLYCDVKTYLPEDILACTDRMSMKHSLEVRVPFIDHKFVELCATIPGEMKIKGRVKKHLLRRVARGMLPDSVLDHRKQGFIGPMTRWLQTGLKDYVVATLAPERLAKHGLFVPSAVKTLLDEHFQRREIHDKLIWSLVMFQTWYEMYVEAPAATTPDGIR